MVVSYEAFSLDSPAKQVQQTANQGVTNPDMTDLYGNVSAFTNAGFVGGQALTAPITGASTQIKASTENILAGLGNGIGGVINTTFSQTGTGVENLGTASGKGLNNFAIGAIPAFAIIVGFVIIMAVAKKV